MKKILSVLLAVTMLVCCVFTFAGCSKNESASFDVVLITDGDTVADGGYNQSAWNGINSYCNENKLSCKYYQPSLDDNGNLNIETIKNYIDLAVKDGAKYVVLPGDEFSVAAVEYAPTYSDVKFILLDSTPKTAGGIDSYQSNVMSVTFDELQAGFLAGYVSVYDGYTKLGYFGSENESSGSYGSGFVKGAASAADELGVPVQLDYANYDSENLSYDYSINIKPVYRKVEEANKTTFKVNVVGGTGSGVYTDGENVTVTANAPDENKKFDHWEVKSNTEGVKDSKVNISSKKDSQINLIVEKCDCTITACWTDVNTYPVTVMEEDGTTVYNTLHTEENTSAWVVAPAAKSGYVFDHWESSDEDCIENINSSSTSVSVTDHEIKMVPIYVKSEKPTFTVNVENGTGSGSYVIGDTVNLVADAPQDGYMFYKWENIDNQGLSTGISMVNEYNYLTSFEMVDRYASVVEKMYDDGTQVVFGGGNSQFESIFTATWNYDYQVYAFGSGVDRNSMGNCLASVVTDYGAAVKLALDNFEGGTILVGNCKNECLYVTGKSINPEDDTYSKSYLNVYKALASGKITLSPYQVGEDIRLTNNSKCLTLNYWIDNSSDIVMAE